MLKNEAGGVTARDAAECRACLKMPLWTKDRKVLHGLLGGNGELCDLCGEGLDSLEHRYWECSRTASFRANVLEKLPNRYRTMMQRGDREFLDFGLVTGSFPVLQTHPGVRETWMPTRQMFTGRVYIDGKMWVCGRQPQ